MATLQERVTALAQAIGADISPLTKRIIVQASGTAKAWVIRRFSLGATANLLEFQTESQTPRLYVDKDMKLWLVAPNGATVSLGAVNYGSDAAVAVERLWVTAGRFVFVPAGSAEMVVNGSAGTMLRFWNDGGGFSYVDFTQATMDINGTITFGDASVQKSALQTTLVTADVNNSTTTLADVTGLTLPVVAGKNYAFRFVLDFTTNATTTGARFTVSGPTSPTTLMYHTRRTTTNGTTVIWSSGHTAYDLPPAATSASQIAGNQAEVWGHIKPSANGNLKLQFASSAASNAVVVKAGSHMELIRLD